MPDLAVVQRIEPDRTAQMTLTERADSLVVVTPQDYQDAGELWKSIDEEIKKRKAFFKPMKDKAFATHKQICADETASLIELEGIKQIISPKMMAWKREQDRIAEEETRKRNEEARRQEIERKLAEAIQAEKEGDTEEARAILDEPIETPVIRVQSAAPKISGLAERKTWTYEIEKEELIPRIWLMVDTVKLGAFVRTDKGKTKIPGIKAIEVSSMGGVRR